MEYALQVKNLYKSYELIKNDKLVHTRTIREAVFNFFKKKGKKQALDVLKDISFELKKGQVIGLIGRNGAGKSTLLKLIAGITYPNKGSINVDGRVGSLLEVGMGFHPDLTGRDNIFLSGAILGMRRSEIKKHFDEIVAFSEVEKFLEMPVKKYSTGMYLKLAFSVMAFLEAEILLIDEVLAVGDFAFQKKCLEKIKEIIKQGKTCIFVSHNLDAIATLCEKTILLENGKIVKNESSSSVIHYYYGISKDLIFDFNHQKDGNFIFEKAWIENEKGEKISSLLSNHNYKFCLSYQNHSQIENLEIILYFTNPEGKKIASLKSDNLHLNSSNGTIIFEIKKFPLNKGFFYFNLLAKSHKVEDFINNAGSFNVVPLNEEINDLFILDYNFTMQKNERK